jgi:hypothetical protein
MTMSPAASFPESSKRPTIGAAGSCPPKAVSKRIQLSPFSGPRGDLGYADDGASSKPAGSWSAISLRAMLRSSA